ncbi:MAG: NAD(P)H-dependent oxidoreductase subunit E [Gammaproteobacteria bacterium]|nr:NAD(P)H-dependent oxidoreductase subunit E [Gammaproteobacteria bacterium]
MVAGTETPPAKKKKKRGQGKGRRVDINALMQVRELLADSPRQRDMLIEYLHRIQDRFGHLSAAHLVALAHELKLATAEVYEVATFYHHFDVVRENDTVPAELTVRVCDSVSCELAGSTELIAGLTRTLGESVRIQPVPCVGRCAEAPVAVVGFNPVDQATVEDVQTHVNNRAVSPENPATHISYSAYKAEGGYRAALECHDGTRSRESVIQLMKDSGLRGLGGAGFPAGTKWDIVSGQEAPRLMAVNVDEGEPGTFKDRFYLESDPHRFLEGMLIAASVVGIDKIWVYTRDEYALGRQILESELAALQADPPYPLPEIELRRGAGAYICGEESAMIESIEGKRGLPRLRPPFVAQVGLFGRPTLEHNFETLFWVRDFIEKGHEWFTSEGRNDRVGLRSFSVSGRVNKPGVHLAPAGITMRELIEEYCGGMLDGHDFYGYFPGGASGGILPAELGDLPLDFDTLQPYGCFIGSAAIVVLSNHDSAKQAALTSMRFFAHESCGQCTPCRVGTEKAAALMEAETWDLERLEDLAVVMEDASICGLGQAAPNPLRCVVKYFPHELGLPERSS